MFLTPLLAAKSRGATLMRTHSYANVTAALHVKKACEGQRRNIVIPLAEKHQVDMRTVTGLIKFPVIALCSAKLESYITPFTELPLTLKIHGTKVNASTESPSHSRQQHMRTGWKRDTVVTWRMTLWSLCLRKSMYKYTIKDHLCLHTGEMVAFQTRVSEVA